MKNTSSKGGVESFVQMRRRNRRRHRKAMMLGYHPDWMNRPQSMELERLLHVEHECKICTYRNWPNRRIRL